MQTDPPREIAKENTRMYRRFYIHSFNKIYKCTSNVNHETEQPV